MPFLFPEFVSKLGRIYDAVIHDRNGGSEGKAFPLY
jgi:hypothetical protein